MSLFVEHRAPRATPPSADSRPLVLVHGFTQNGRCWGRFADHLAEHHPLALVDAPGHGRSGHDDAGLERAADLVLDAGGDAHYVGYSMGGRILLHAALADPSRIRSLTLIGATAGIDDPIARAERRRADEALADRLEQDGLDAFLDRWLALPLFAGVDEAASCRSERLTNRSAGLASSLRNCGTGTQAPLWDRLAEIDIPTLVIAGSGDAKFRDLGGRIVDHIGGSRFVSIDGGHAVHLESPEETADTVSRFVRSFAE